MLQQNNPRMVSLLNTTQHMYPGFEPWGFQAQNCSTVDDCFRTTTAAPSGSMVCRAFRPSEQKLCHCDTSFGFYGEGCLTAPALSKIIACLGVIPSMYVAMHLFRAIKLFINGTAPRKSTFAWFALVFSIVGLLGTELWIYPRISLPFVTTAAGYEIVFLIVTTVSLSFTIVFQLVSNCTIALAWLSVMQNRYTAGRGALKPKLFLVFYSINLILLVVFYIVGAVRRDFKLPALFGVVMMFLVGVSVKIIGRNLVKILPTSSDSQNTSESTDLTVDRTKSRPITKTKTRNALKRCLVASKSMSNRMLFTVFILFLNGIIPALPPLPNVKFHPAVVFSVINPLLIATTLGSVINYIVATVSDIQAGKNPTEKYNSANKLSAISNESSATPLFASTVASEVH